ncbi:MAG: single-stranded-DNA-specific exonuclease RecJ [Defluviitaleaceae bacterium]|nr:single-stranded-DNA-specific exonuclease RecJ [Defluviitaleaceae bacterium]
MASGIKWSINSTDADLALMSQVLGIKEATAAVMANRGIRSKKAALAYLRPDIVSQSVDILDPEQGMKDVKKAFDRIVLGIRQKERIMIYGDYDADGVMSTVILYKALKLCGANISYYIPHREEEGYGLNIKAVRAIKETDHDLLITCDNGISALAEIAEANALGMDVIVIDHHEPGFVDGENPDDRQDVIPEAAAVVDPKQAACPYPFKDMCAAGLAYKLMESFYGYTGQDFLPLKDELTVLASVATICDIVDLIGENRALVKQGLKLLSANKQINGGLGQLLALKGYMDKPIDTFVLGYILGPCINATGRLESAEMSVRLLLSSDTTEQAGLAKILSDLNEERKNLTKQCVDRALENLTAAEDKVLVLVDTETHESIAGIVAGRVKETLYRPTIVLTRAAEPGVLKGSGRSIEGYNMFEALYANRELFKRFGGHAMAAGLSLAEENVPELVRRLNDGCTLTESDMHPVVQIDMELPVREIALDLAEELEWLAPFGKGNREPLFVTCNLPVSALRVINDKNTLIFTFDIAGRKIKGIAFGQNEAFLAELQENYSEQAYRQIASGQAADAGLTMDVVHSVESNTYNGNTSVQMRIKSFKIQKP